MVCAAACLHPHNSISNVVVSVIHDFKYLHVCNHCGRSKASSTEHHGKCLTCTSLVKLGFCLLSLSLSVSLSQLGLAGQGRVREGTLKPFFLTSSGQVFVFLCDLLVSQQHISQLFVQAMAAAGLGYRKSGKNRARSSNQGWSPNSGQAAHDESGSFVDVLVSEQGQHSSSSGLT